jgi:hypothetical protein
MQIATFSFLSFFVRMVKFSLKYLLAAWEIWMVGYQQLGVYCKSLLFIWSVKFTQLLSG